MGAARSTARHALETIRHTSLDIPEGAPSPGAPSRMSIQVREAYYRARVRPCPTDVARIRDNVAYAILSVHCSTAECDRLFGTWRAHGRPADESAIYDAWADMGKRAMFTRGKSAWLAALCAVPDAWLIAHAQDREALDTLPGLGKVKASFAAALNGANVACLDRHIVRALRRRTFDALLSIDGMTLERADARLAPRTWAQYRALERVLAARDRGASRGDLFVSQWRAWNVLRGTNETHAVLWAEPVPF